MEVYGYAGKVLYVDLSTGKIEKEPLDLDQASRFIGGAGLTYVLLERLLKQGTDPMSPDNPIVVGAGPLVGTPVPGAGKLGGTTKFALPADEESSRYVVASGISGSQRFGVMLKRAGYDHLVITGKADTPALIRILDDDVHIEEAGHLWGKKDAYETVDTLRQDQADCGVLCIGEAGENQVRFALALTDKGSTMGRNGFGAVMGSKNLKAVCVRGTTPDGDLVLKDYYGRRQPDENDLERMLDDYYDERGWDPKDGTPTRGKLNELGLTEYAET